MVGDKVGRIGLVAVLHHEDGRVVGTVYQRIKPHVLFTRHLRHQAPGTMHVQEEDAYAVNKTKTLLLHAMAYTVLEHVSCTPAKPCSEHTKPHPPNAHDIGWCVR